MTPRGNYYFCCKVIKIQNVKFVKGAGIFMFLH